MSVDDRSKKKFFRLLIINSLLYIVQLMYCNSELFGQL